MRISCCRALLSLSLISVLASCSQCATVAPSTLTATATGPGLLGATQVDDTIRLDVSLDDVPRGAASINVTVSDGARSDTEAFSFTVNNHDPTVPPIIGLFSPTLNNTALRNPGRHVGDRRPRARPRHMQRPSDRRRHHRRWRRQIGLITNADDISDATIITGSLILGGRSTGSGGVLAQGSTSIGEGVRFVGNVIDADGQAGNTTTATAVRVGFGRAVVSTPAIFAGNTLIPGAAFTTIAATFEEQCQDTGLLAARETRPIRSENINFHAASGQAFDVYVRDAARNVAGTQCLPVVDVANVNTINTGAGQLAPYRAASAVSRSFDVDSLFTPNDPARHIERTSPLIDQAPAAVDALAGILDAVDLDGELRPINGAFEIGRDEIEP